MRRSINATTLRPVPGLLESQNLERWQRLGEIVRSLLPQPGFQRALSEDVGGWSVEERDAWLDAALAVAPRSARAAVAVYREAPPALRALPSTLRGRLLDILRLAAAAADPVELTALIPVLGALILEIPITERGDALDLALSVAKTYPVAALGLVRCLARLTEEATDDRIRLWVERGFELAKSRPEAARAYFALESRTSNRILHSSPTAASLEEREGVLHRYIQMLSGVPAFVRPGGPFLLRPPLEETPAAGGVVLPATIEILDTWEDNARLYRVLAALLAGRREFGTYAAPDVVTHIRDTEHPAALEACFLLADGYRVARRLAMSYPGLRGDLAWAMKTLQASWQEVPPSMMLLLDMLLAHAIAPQQELLAPWARGAAAVVVPCLTPLAAPAATASDALVTAGLLAALLSFPASHKVSEASLSATAEPSLAAGDDGPQPSAASAEDVAGGDARAPQTAEDISPELLADLQIQLGELAERMTAAGRPLTAEELMRLVESGLISQLAPGTEATFAQAGLYVTQLVGKVLGEKPLARHSRAASSRTRSAELAGAGPMFLYDEWDHVIADYRPSWCCLREVDITEDPGSFFTRTLERYAPLVPEIRRHFQRVRPESWRIVRGLEDGDDFDLNAAIDARAEWRARRSPSPKLYTARARIEREVATLFLLDMSASTDEAAEAGGARRRIIDIEKEALVIMAAALEEIGDMYAIYGFSGQGRHSVEFYPVKTFTERLGAGAKGRIGGIQPRSSTRMGAPLRHSVRKMANVRTQARYLILISDGFPQDLDYGEDRRSYDYGISDTAVALREVEAARIKPFCITVDLAGHDYLRQMCDPQRYMVIENVGDLPRELPKIYQQLVRAA